MAGRSILVLAASLLPLVVSSETIHPHEMARLPMIYSSARDFAGDGHWREQYEKYADDAIDMSELRYRTPYYAKVVGEDRRK